jgi:hypothetical protein
MLERRGDPNVYDIFKVNGNYTCVAMGSTQSGHIRALCSTNFMGNSPVREVEFSVGNQGLRDIFIPTTLDINQQAMYYTTQNGAFYVSKSKLL